MTTLTDLITEANSSGWAVTLRQHPDRRAYWECALSRPIEQIMNGIAREIAFAIGPTPYSALDLALAQPHTETLRPTGLTDDLLAVPSLASLLNLLSAARTVPTITRR